MAVISKGTTFATGDQVTALKLNDLADAATFASGAVDSVSTQLSGGAIIVKDGGVSTAKIADDAVTTAKIADSNVTKAKIEDVANMKVLGNTSGSATAPQEVSVLDEDNMSSDSATAIATQQSIKSYVDNSSTDGFSPTTYAGGESVTLPNGLIMKFGKVSGTGTTEVTYGTAFPNAVLSIVITNIDSGSNNSAGSSNPHIKTGYSTSSFECYINTEADNGTFWQAIGY